MNRVPRSLPLALVALATPLLALAFCAATPNRAAAFPHFTTVACDTVSTNSACAGNRSSQRKRKNNKRDE